MPALKRAEVAVSSLKPGDINEIKALKKNIPIICYVMDCICIFLGDKLEPVKMAGDGV